MEQLIMKWENDGSNMPLFVPKGLAFSPLSKVKDGIKIWCSLMQYGLSSGNVGEEYYRRNMTDFSEKYSEDDCFIIFCGGVAVGTITTICDYDRHDAYIHMVACRSDYRGRGIGTFMNSLAVWTLKERKMKTAHLTTDDWRIPAIRSYLRIGFIPDETTEERKRRWNAIRSRLGEKIKYTKLTNAKIVLYDRVITGTVTICDDTTSEITEDYAEGGIDMGGCYIAPIFADKSTADDCCLSLSAALKNMREKTDDAIVELMRAESTTPARDIGIWDRGEVCVSKKADFVILSDKLNIEAVYLSGKKI